MPSPAIVGSPLRAVFLSITCLGLANCTRVASNTSNHSTGGAGSGGSAGELSSVGGSGGSSGGGGGAAGEAGSKNGSSGGASSGASGGSGGSSSGGASSGGASSGGASSGASGGSGGSSSGGASSGGSGGSGGSSGTGGMGQLDTPPSCAGELGSECQGRSCCSSLWVPMGSYRIGRGENSEDPDYFPAGLDNELPEVSVVLDGFYLDEFEVTVGRFRNFVESYDGSPPIPGSGAVQGQVATGWVGSWDNQVASNSDQLISSVKCDPKATWSDEVGTQEQYAINCVDWYTAFQFCIWDGGRLATEAEWEAAAGNQLYPWGNADLTCATANVGCGNLYVEKVGSHPAGVGPHGHLDLAVNVAEWVLDGYSADTYDSWTNQPLNPVYLASVSQRAVRGSWFGDGNTAEARVVARHGTSPGNNLEGGGIRCAREPNAD